MLQINKIVTQQLFATDKSVGADKAEPIVRHSRLGFSKIRVFPGPTSHNNCMSIKGDM